MKKALIYSPYWQTLGGGEAYSLSVAQYFAKKGFETVLAARPQIIDQAKTRFGLDLIGVSIDEQIYKYSAHPVKKFLSTRKFDYVFTTSDGSIPFLFGAKNLLHFQMPFSKVGGRSFFNKIKLSLVHKVICNSAFTKSFIDREYNVSSVVVYPPLIAPGNPNPKKKKNMILSVGRFDNLLHGKKQDLMIRAFKELVDEGLLSGWQLVLAGGLSQSQDYFNFLTKLALGYPIKLYKNLPNEELRELYSQAKIYWHAAGCGEDLENNPEKAEHFGISVLEAASAGAVPIVFSGGGLKEIIRDRVDGFLFSSLQDLERLTVKVVNDNYIFKKLQRNAIKRSADFSLARFYSKMDEIV